MRVALIASPFISVPPAGYGGTELFVSNLAEGLKERGITAVVYSNGESTVQVENRWRYRTSEWPLADGSGMFKELDHVAWSIQNAARDCDLIHINSAPAVTYSRFVPCPFVCTLHHPYEEPLTRFYEMNSDVFYTAISHHQASLHPTLDLQTIHHGLDFRKYRLQIDKESYLAFLGRIAPIKGTHLAVEVAQRTGIPLKIAGEIQPIFRDYYETMVKPHVDGKFIEYVGEVGLEAKNQLLGGAIGLLFPIQWEEPFGLVLIEAMACGTPVFAFHGGAVCEIVSDGISGNVSKSVEDMATAATQMKFDPRVVRNWAETMFSVETMVDRYVDLYHTILNCKMNPTPMKIRPARETAA
ncbi:MAG: glycosyltransferase family 4 protein [Acidobacteriaceae bacterium]